jgi:ribosomal protein S18 acetylase RimI-like enzyme
MNYSIVDLTNKDESIVWKMLVYAAQQRSIEDVQKHDYLPRYAMNWGRRGDMGVVAKDDVRSITKVGYANGAAWLRLWLNDDKGFGYIDDAIPELAIAVLPEYRGKGIGTQLLMKVLASAQSIYPAISLSVRANNPAVNLYQRLGFTKVDGSEIIVEGVVSSFNMIHKFT